MTSKLAATATLSPRIVTPPSKNEMSSNLEKKIDSLTDGALPYYNSVFKKLCRENYRNAEILYDFIMAEYTNQNIKPSTKLTHIKIICGFSRSLSYKDYQLTTKKDIMEYLSSLRKPELEDPTHKWIGTFNTRQIILGKFFRWYYNQQESDLKKWINPPCINGIKQLPRKEKSPYKPSDIWTHEDNALFLKYCPDKRDRCYHAMANDTSARPHELLSLRIKDIMFKLSSTGKQYAEVHITESKTRPRTLPLIFSIPYIKDWIDSHPLGNNPNTFLFVSLADANYGEQLSQNALYKLYVRTYKNRYFRKLAADGSSIPEVDKSYIKNLLTKPWNPYIIRHSALTSKSIILKESTLRDHAGWSTSSKMPNIYIHYFGNESSRSLLEAYGIEKYQEKQTNILMTKACPNCSESNKPDSKFCVKCRMVLSYDAYSETLEEQKQKESELKLLQDRHEQDMKGIHDEMERRDQKQTQKLNQIISMIRENPNLAKVKTEVLTSM